MINYLVTKNQMLSFNLRYNTAFKITIDRNFTDYMNLGVKKAPETSQPYVWGQHCCNGQKCF